MHAPMYAVYMYIHTWNYIILSVRMLFRAMWSMYMSRLIRSSSIIRSLVHPFSCTGNPTALDSGLLSEEKTCRPPPNPLMYRDLTFPLRAIIPQYQRGQRGSDNSRGEGNTPYTLPSEVQPVTRPAYWRGESNTPYTLPSEVQSIIRPAYWRRESNTSYSLKYRLSLALLIEGERLTHRTLGSTDSHSPCLLKERE